MKPEDELVKDIMSQDPFKSLMRAQEFIDEPKDNSAPIPINQSRLRRSFKVAVLFILLMSITFGIYKYIEYRKNSQLKEALEKEAISKMAARYNAVVNWRQSLEDIENVYSLNVEEALIGKDNRPVLLSVYVRDIVRKAEIHYVLFDESGPPDPEINFNIEFTQEQINRLKELIDDGSGIAVVASISSVHRLKDSEALDKFVADGKCLDFLPLKH